MKTPTHLKLFRVISLMISLIILASLAFSHPSIIAVAADDSGAPAPSSPPRNEPLPTNTPAPYPTGTATETPLPYFTPTASFTPTPTMTFTPTPTGSVTPTPSTTFTPTPTGTITPEPIDPPDIAISPTAFDVSLNQGEISTEVLTIMNAGDSELTFSITAIRQFGQHIPRPAISSNQS